MQEINNSSINCYAKDGRTRVFRNHKIIFVLSLSLILILEFTVHSIASEQVTKYQEHKSEAIQKLESAPVNQTENGRDNYQKIDLAIAALAAFSTFLAVFWVLFKDTVLNYWKRPMFKCDLKIESPYISKTNIEYKSSQFIEYIPGYYYHIRVFNEGRSIAKSCIGYIEEIYYLCEDGNYLKTQNFLALPVSWAHEGHIHTHINPKQEKYLDIGYIAKRYFKVFNLPDEAIPRLGKQGDIVFRLCFNRFPIGELSELWAGSYKIKISIYSENTKSFSGYLNLKWSGNWKDDYEEMKKEIELDFSTSFT